MPDKPRRRKKPSRDTQKIAVGVYVLVLVVAFTNWTFPSSAFPLVSFNFWSHESISWPIPVPPQQPEPPGVFPQPSIAEMNVSISASQPFADGVPITVNVYGCVRYSNFTDFTSWTAGFNNSYDSKYPGTIFKGELLIAISGLSPKPPAAWPSSCPADLGANAVHFIGQVNDATFYFGSPGNYPLIVSAATLGNKTATHYIYSDNTIYIQSSATLSANVVSRAEALVVIATFAFGFFEAFALLELFPALKKHFQ